LANGTDKAQSDVDLLVIGTVGLRGLSRLLSSVSGKVGREVNPHVFTVEEFARRKKARDHFISTVLRGSKLFVVGSEHELEAMGR
jgi:predicted nucleotidyltransferase